MLWSASSHVGTYCQFNYVFISLSLNFLVPHFLFQNVMYYLSFNYVTFRDFLILQFYQLILWASFLFLCFISIYLSFELHIPWETYSVYFISFIIINPFFYIFTTIFLSKHRWHCQFISLFIQSQLYNSHTIFISMF